MKKKPSKQMLTLNTKTTKLGLTLLKSPTEAPTIAVQKIPERTNAQNTIESPLKFIF